MSGMGWRTTGDVAEFHALAGEYLRAERARNTVLLTVTENLRVDPARYSGDPADAGDAANRPLFGWWEDPAGKVAGAFLHTPPFPVLLSAVPREVAAELAAATLAGRPLAGVNGDAEVAEAFAGAWQAAVGCRTEIHRRLRLYRLAELTWPDPAPEGESRVAVDSDVVLVEWFAAFAREVGDMGGSADQESAVRDRLGYGGVTVWQVGGEPVSIAGNTRCVAGMVRIGPVYTPPELRGRGYASAATAAVSRRVLEAGAEEVLLYTDLANPVSNSIYQRIGYRAVEDRVALAFTAG